MVQNASVNLSGKELKMNKNVIIELDDDGFVAGVYCPDATYTVDILDKSDRNPSPEVERYYDALEKETENLKNCY